MNEGNWAGNVTYRASTIQRPESVDALQRCVAGASRIRALGSRHSFNDLADADELVSLERLDLPMTIDRDAMSVTVSAGTSYGSLAGTLVREGLALHAMASLPHISIAGAIATATHGSGDACGNLATAVSGLEMVTGDGDLVRVRRGDPDFPGMVVGLGALGIITRVTLDVEPEYRMHQQVFVDLAWDVLFDRFDQVTASADSVSLFTDYGDTINQVWLKSRVTAGEVPVLRQDVFGAPAATRPMHPVRDFPADSVTGQLGVPGLWSERLPHFRLDATPSVGAELQSEYLVGREDAVAALQAIRGLSEIIRPYLLVSEIRTIAADDLWLSTAYGRDSVGIHFTWKPDEVGVRSILPSIESALAPFGPRPHWGKLFVAQAGDLAPRYERLEDFRGLAQRLDPGGRFRNTYLERAIGIGPVY